MLPTLKEAIDKAMTDQSSTIEWVHTGAEIVEGVEVVLEVVAAGETGAISTAIAGLLENTIAGVILPVAGAAASVASEFAVLGLGYAEAASKIKEDRAGVGFAKGVVLGVYKAQADIVESRFFELIPEENNFWPEAGVFAQNYHNAALVVGYRYGYELNQDEAAAFWEDLGRGRDLAAVLGVPIPNDDSPENDWRNFYIAAGVKFWKLHIGDQDT